MDVNWTTQLDDARDLVAKGYSIEVPRWMVREHLQGLFRKANAEGNEQAADQLMWLIEEWNRKA